jgi:hypothetical protein
VASQQLQGLQCEPFTFFTRTELASQSLSLGSNVLVTGSMDNRFGSCFQSSLFCYGHMFTSLLSEKTIPIAIGTSGTKPMR